MWYIKKNHSYFQGGPGIYACLVVVSGSSRSDTDNKSTQQHKEGKKVFTEEDQSSIMVQGMGTGMARGHKKNNKQQTDL